MNVTLDRIKKRRKANDVVLTPRKLAKQHIDVVATFLPSNLRQAAVWYDPFRYNENGSYFAQFPTKNKIWAEINEGRDFFTHTKDVDKVSVICGNPPYSILESVLKHSAQIKPLIVSYLCSFNNFTARRLQIMQDAGYNLVYVRVHKKIKHFATGVSALFVWKLTNQTQSVLHFDRRVWRCKANVEFKQWRSQQQNKQCTLIPIEELAKLQVQRTRQIIASGAVREKIKDVWLDPFRNKEVGDLYSFFPENVVKCHCSASFDYSNELKRSLQLKNVPAELRVSQQHIPSDNIFTKSLPAKVDVVCGVLPKNLKQMYTLSVSEKKMVGRGKSAPHLDAIFEKLVGMHPSVISLMIVDYNITPQRLHFMHQHGYTMRDCVMLKRYFSANMSFICVWQKNSSDKSAIDYSMERFSPETTKKKLIATKSGKHKRKRCE